jgi:uncharacterized protein YkwD
MRKALVIAVVIVSLVLLVAAPTASAITLTKPEKQLLTLINKARAKQHVPPLKINPKLERAARAHSAEMLAYDYFGHNSFNGETFSQRLIRFGYTQSNCISWRAGENIANGLGLLGTPEAVMEGWMASKAHRAVILSRNMKECGIGRAMGEFNGFDGVSLFTLDMGKRCLK